MSPIEQAESIPSTDRDLMLELKRLAAEFAPGAQLFLYRSAARGTREPDSDYDVLILLERALSRQEIHGIRDAIYDLELAREVVISPVFMGREEWNSPAAAATPYYRAVSKEAIQL